MNFVAKPQAPSNYANILTLGAYREMLDFDRKMKTEIYLEQNGIKYFYEDLCETFSPNEIIVTDEEGDEEVQTIGRSASRPCRRTPIPIDFVYDRETDSYSIEQFANDA